MFFAPSHRNTDDPQPEFCDLCGLKVGGAHLMVVHNVEGLRGKAVCDVTPGCRAYRSRPTRRDVLHEYTKPYGTIGDSRIHPAGGEDWETCD